MQIPDPQTLRRAFINSSRSKVASMSLPAPWPPVAPDDLDFVGWVDPKAPRRAYLAVGPPTLDDLTCIELRLPSAPPGRGRQTMCDVCQSSEAPGGSLLMVAPRAGSRGRKGDSIGIYLCADFACSAHARQPLKAHERSLTGMPDTRVPAMVERIATFIDRVGS